MSLPKINLLAAVVIALALCVVPRLAMGQTPANTAEVMRQPVVKLPVYEMPIAGSRHVVLTMQFASPQWLDTSGIALLAGATILAVDLVFTDYPARLDLKPLNTSRFNALFAALPMLTANTEVQYSIVRQMTGNTKASAAGMMHGFVVHYRPAPQKTDVEDEAYLLKAATPPMRIKTPRPPTGKLRHWDYKYRQPTTSTDIDDSPLDTGTYTPPIIRDSVFLKGAKRLGLRNMVVVADVTGSMAPYNRDLLLWLQQPDHQAIIKHLVFFNDGDALRDSEKTLGKTGGIYAAPYTDIFAAAHLMAVAKRHLGGDFAENDLEALLVGQQQCADSSQLVLLADSWAPVRDLALVKKLNRPVRIFAMGGHLGIHPDYISIALTTGGSIHFANEDICDFEVLKAGKPQTIRQKNYRWDGERVVRG